MNPAPSPRGSDGPPPEQTWVEFLSDPATIPLAIAMIAVAWLAFAIARKAWQVRKRH